MVKISVFPPFDYLAMGKGLHDISSVVPIVSPISGVHTIPLSFVPPPATG